MGNCWIKWKPAMYSFKQESPKVEVPFEKIEKIDENKLPTNAKEVEDSCRDSGAMNLVAFTFAELKVITHNFRADYILGGGGSRRVYRGRIKKGLRDGIEPLQVVVKVHNGDKSFQGHREWLAEVVFLAQLSHPNLVKLVGYCCEDDQRVLVYEYMARGSIENNFFSRVLVTLPWSIRMKIALGAARGLAYLHDAEKQVIYCDSKTFNILLDMDYNAKLSGFGLAKGGPIGNKFMGTWRYISPEYIATGRSTSRSDVYSFGVVLLELLTGRKSFDEFRPPEELSLVHWALPMLTEKEKVLNIVDQRLEGDYPTEGIHKAAMLAYHCLSFNPKERPLMREIVDSLETLQVPVEIPDKLS